MPAFSGSWTTPSGGAWTPPKTARFQAGQAQPKQPTAAGTPYQAPANRPQPWDAPTAGHPQINSDPFGAGANANMNPNWVYYDRGGGMVQESHNAGGTPASHDAYGNPVGGRLYNPHPPQYNIQPTPTRRRR